MNSIEKMLFEKTISISNCIANENYEQLIKDGCLIKFSKDDILFAIERYGGKVSVIDACKYDGRYDCFNCQNNIYETELDLIIDNRVSDLTLICEIKIEKSRVVYAIISDLHVL